MRASGPAAEAQSVPSLAGVDRSSFNWLLLRFGILMISKLRFQRAHPEKWPSKRQEAEAARSAKLPRTDTVTFLPSSHQNSHRARTRH